MPNPAEHWGTALFPLLTVGTVNTSTYAMAPSGTGWCARFTAKNTQDIKSVILAWSAVSAPGTVQLRIETIDPATGKPTGTLYDSNAEINNIVPALNAQTYTFSVQPSAGLTAGNEYAILLLTTSAGTTQSLRAYSYMQDIQSYPTIALTAADGTTRSNFSEVAGATPMASIIWEDNTQESVGLCPYYVAVNNNVYTTNAAAVKIVLPTQQQIAGVFGWLSRTGTPSGDLRVRLFDSSNNVVTNTTKTLNKNSLMTQLAARKRVQVLFENPITLSAGTYRIVWDSPSSVNSSNSWNLTSSTFLSSNAVPNNFRLSTCPDVGTPVWTDSSTDSVPCGFLLNDLVTSGNIGGMLIHSGMSGGLI